MVAVTANGENACTANIGRISAQSSEGITDCRAQCNSDGASFMMFHENNRCECYSTCVLTRRADSLLNLVTVFACDPPEPTLRYRWWTNTTSRREAGLNNCWHVVEMQLFSDSACSNQLTVQSSDLIVSQRVSAEVFSQLIDGDLGTFSEIRSVDGYSGSSEVWFGIAGVPAGELMCARFYQGSSMSNMCHPDSEVVFQVSSDGIWSDVATRTWASSYDLQWLELILPTATQPAWTVTNVEQDGTISKTPTANHRRPLPFCKRLCG